jgi:hypothetical protein
MISTLLHNASGLGWILLRFNVEFRVLVKHVLH